MNISYAKVYSLKEGDFSRILGSSILNFLKSKNYKVNSVLDVACGTGEFVSVLRNGCVDVSGIDFEKAMINIAKKNVPDVNFSVAPLFEFDLGRTFDLISMNYETVNFALEFDALVKLFANVARHLNSGGIFVFDFLTPFADIKNDFKFDESSDFDYFKRLSVAENIYTKTEIIYQLTPQNYKKIKNVENRRVWSVDDIKKALAVNGFYNHNFVDYSLNVLKKPKKTSRVHVLVYKK